MNLRKDLIEISAATFNGIFKHHHDSLVKQVAAINDLMPISMFLTFP